MKKLLLSIFILMGFVSFGQYTPMTAAGYQFKRIVVDSTLHLPSFCGIPTLRNSLSKNGALAMDTCNNKLYKWTNQAGWSEITGGGGTGIDSLKRSSDSVYAYKNGQWIFQFKDSVGGGGSQDLQSVTNVGNTTTNDIYSNSIYIRDQQTFPDPAEPFYTRLKGDDMSFRVYTDTFYGYTNPLLNVSDLALVGRQGNLNIGFFYPNPMTSSLNYNLPDTSGILALSVNNQFADSKGNITISTGSQNGRFGNDTATIVMAKVHNDAGVQLTNGKVVYLSTSGTSSDAPSVKLANNKGDSSSANTFGFVSGTIAVNDTGWVILSGKIEKLNTSAYSNGDIIYLDSISGSFTKNKPQAPYHMVYLGVVVKANAGNGAIFVKPQNGYEIEELHDVQVNGRQNNQILVYSDTQKVWKNRSIYSVVDTTNVIATKTNVAAKVASVSGTSPISSSGGTTPTISISQASSTTNGYLSSADYTTLSNNNILAAYQLLGSSYKSTSLGVLNPAMLSTGGAISDGSLRVSAIYVPVATTITGIKWFQTVQGNYTADNYNGIGLYTYSGGTLTLVASSTNDGNIWKGATNTWQSKAFSSTYSAAVGVYYVGVLYNSSAETTPPSLGAATTMSNAGVSTQDFTNSAKLSSSLAAQTALPATQAMSGTTNSNINFGFWLY